MTHPPRRVLMTADAVGGVWRQTLELAHAVRGLGIGVTLAQFGPPCSEAQRREAAGLDLRETGLALDWTAETRAELERSAEAAAAIAAAAGCELAHLHTPAFAPAFPIPTLAMAHSCPRTWAEAVYGRAAPDWRAEAIREGLLCADVAAAPSAAFAAALQQSYALPRAPVVLRNGAAPAPAPALGAPAAYALTAGRLWDAAKDAATLDAAAGLARTPILAAGALRNPMGGEARFARLRCTGPLPREALQTRLARRPIYVSAAVYEPFGLGVLEAAQAGCALVLADIPTHRELWEGAAVFAPPRAPASFAAAIDGLAATPAARALWATAAAYRAKRYNREAMLDAALKAWREACRFRQARGEAAA